jgi:hypothetical protein
MRNLTDETQLIVTVFVLFYHAASSQTFHLEGIGKNKNWGIYYSFHLHDPQVFKVLTFTAAFKTCFRRFVSVPSL